MSGFTVQPAELYDNGSRYQQTAQDMATIYNTLVGKLEAEGACWGNDEAGQGFGSKYCPQSLAALQQMSNSNTSFQTMVDGVCGWARNFVNVDDMIRQQQQAPTLDV